MKRILFAIDFSESCTNAANYLKELIRGTDIKVDLVHVYHVPITLISTISEDTAIDVIEEKKVSTRKLLEEQMEFFDDKNRGDLYPVYGINPSNDIVDTSTSSSADMIVMALRQKYSMVDRFIGTVTAQTISKTIVPVLAIPNGSVYKESCNILFPTQAPYADHLTENMSSLLVRLFNYCNLFRESNLYMVHIQEDKSLDIMYKHNPLPNTSFIVSHAETVDQGIFKILSKHDIDLIAIQRSSRRFWERLYHSSVTRKLLFQARLPLLIFNNGS